VQQKNIVIPMSKLSILTYAIPSVLMRQNASKLTCVELRLHSDYLASSFAHCFTQKDKIVTETYDYTIT